MRSPLRRRPRRIDTPPSRLDLRDLIGEAMAGIVQRPGRAVLTMLGTVLGVGAFVAVLGLTATASGQISQQFTVLDDTTVSVADNVGTGAATTPDTNPPMSFPADADARADRIDGVVAAGVWWPLGLSNPTITSAPGTGSAGSGLAVYAATPGAVAAMQLTITAGTTLDPYENKTAQHVVLLSTDAASSLGVARLDAQPAIFINGIPYTVVGIYSTAQRVDATALGMIIPASTALAVYGNPDSSVSGDEAQMVIWTRLGAAQVVAKQVPDALRPDQPSAFTVTAPADPHTLQNQVTGDLTSLFLVLAAICLIIGAVGIANTTLVAVLERTEEIGLRRSLGARPRHIAGQFLAESTALGTLGGLIGTSLGVLTVLVVADTRQWTALLDPALTLPAPVIGSVVGLLAGTYPALRAAHTSPLAALRHG